MKKILLVLPVFAVILYAYSQNSRSFASKEGIKFLEGSFNEAIEQSSVSNKLIFLDISTSWCGYCKKLKRNTFSDKGVGTFFNANFINISIDAEEGEGVFIAKNYGVRSYPTLIILDKSKKVILVSEGYLGSRDLIELGKKAIQEVKK